MFAPCRATSFAAWILESNRGRFGFDSDSIRIRFVFGSYSIRVRFVFDSHCFRIAMGPAARNTEPMGSDDAIPAEDMPSLVYAYCEGAIMRIPSGVCGSIVAVSWIRAFSQACLLGWGDITDSSPGHFRRLVDASLIERCPSDRAMVAATRLVASVSGLVAPRSARRWTAWYASACDPDSSIGQEIRRGVTPAMLARARSYSPALGAPEEADSPRLPNTGTRTLRAERDKIENVLRITRLDLEQARAGELAMGARCKIAEVALVSAMRKNLDLLDQLQHARDRAERAQRSTSKPVGASRSQQLEDQLRDLEDLHNRTLQCFAATLDSLAEAAARSQAEAVPGESVAEELSKLASTLPKSARLVTDKTREALALAGVILPSTK